MKESINLFYSSEDGKAFLIKENIIPEGYAPVGSAVFGYKEVSNC